jgi:hypothetical protein
MPSCFSYLRQSAPAVTPFICPCTADQPSWPSATAVPGASARSRAGRNGVYSTGGAASAAPSAAAAAAAAASLAAGGAPLTQRDAVGDGGEGRQRATSDQRRTQYCAGTCKVGEECRRVHVGVARPHSCGSAGGPGGIGLAGDPR